MSASICAFEWEPTPLFDTYNADSSSDFAGGDIVFRIPEKEIARKTFIELTDGAGNKERVYLCSTSENKFTENKDEAAFFIIDTQAPDCKASLSYDEAKVHKSQIITEDNETQQWFTDYPEIPVEISEANKSICSGIDSLEVNLNGQKILETSRINSTETSAYKVKISDVTDDKTKYSVVLLKDSEEICSSQIDKSQSGILDFSFTVKDNACNSLTYDLPAFYVDNSTPVINRTFTVTPLETDTSINFTGFGSFARDKVVVNVKVTDMTPSSGMDKVMLKVANKEYAQSAKPEINDQGQYIYKFVIPDEQMQKDAVLSGNISASACDRAGNRTVWIDTDGVLQTSEWIPLTSDAGSPLLMIENVKPEFSSQISGENVVHYRNESTGQDWYSGDVNVDYSITDADSGLFSISQSVKNQHDAVTGTYSWETGKNDGELLKLINSQMHTDPSSDGRFTFTCGVTDNSGNIQTGEMSVYKDITAPQITGFVLDNTVDMSVKHFSDIVSEYSSSALSQADMNDLMYRFFSQTPTAVTVSATDSNATSGLKCIRYTLYDENSNVISSHEQPVDSEGKISFLLDEGFKGNVCAQAVDNVLNTSSPVCMSGAVLENDSRHQEISDISVALPDTPYTDINGLPLYKSDITAQISAHDRFSGIQNIMWSISENGIDTWNDTHFDTDSYMNQGDEKCP